MFIFFQMRKLRDVITLRYCFENTSTNSCQSFFRDIMSMKLNWLCLIFSMFFISFRVISRPLHQGRELNGILRWQPDLFITLLQTWEVSKDIFNLLGFCWEQTHHREFQGWNVVRVYTTKSGMVGMYLCMAWEKGPRGVVE